MEKRLAKKNFENLKLVGIVTTQAGKLTTNRCGIDNVAQQEGHYLRTERTQKDVRRFVC